MWGGGVTQNQDEVAAELGFPKLIPVTWCLPVPGAPAGRPDLQTRDSTVTNLWNGFVHLFVSSNFKNAEDEMFVENWIGFF